MHHQYSCCLVRHISCLWRVEHPNIPFQENVQSFQHEEIVFTVVWIPDLAIVTFFSTTNTYKITSWAHFATSVRESSTHTCAKEAASTGGVQVISSILPSICNTLPDGSPQMFSITLQWFLEQLAMGVSFLVIPFYAW